MISQQSSSEVEVTLERVESKYISIECTDTIILSTLAIDDDEIPGDYRFFHPLIVTIDGTPRSFPADVPSGLHTIELLGEIFRGVGLLIVGYGLHAVKDVKIGSTESVTAARLAQVPGYYEGDGPPDGNQIVVGAINGSRYKDRLNKIRYELSEGIWIQLAS